MAALLTFIVRDAPGQSVLVFMFSFFSIFSLSTPTTIKDYMTTKQKDACSKNIDNAIAESKQKAQDEENGDLHNIHRIQATKGVVDALRIQMIITDPVSISGDNMRCLFVDYSEHCRKMLQCLPAVMMMFFDDESFLAFLGPLLGKDGDHIDRYLKEVDVDKILENLVDAVYNHKEGLEALGQGRPYAVGESSS